LGSLHFKQLEPKVLFAVDGYQYSGKPLDRRSLVAELQQLLPSLQQTVLVPYLNKDAGTEGLTNVMLWQDALRLQERDEITFEQVPFDQPLWILYSSEEALLSGSTGHASNKRSSAPAPGPTNAFFNAHQLYSSHLIILFPDSKRPGVAFPLWLARGACPNRSCVRRGTHTKLRGTVLWESKKGEMHVSS
jgi:hypothetical protein